MRLMSNHLLATTALGLLLSTAPAAAQRSPEAETMVQSVAHFIRGLCGNLTPEEARAVAEAAVSQGVKSVAHLQLLWVRKCVRSRRSA